MGGETCSQNANGLTDLPPYLSCGGSEQPKRTEKALWNDKGRLYGHLLKLHFRRLLGQIQTINCPSFLFIRLSTHPSGWSILLSSIHLDVEFYCSESGFFVLSMWKRLVKHTSLQCRGCNTFSRFSQLSYCSAKPLLSELMATKISRGDEYFVAWTVFHGFFFSFNSLRNSLLGKVSLIMETRNITGNEGREMWH